MAGRHPFDENELDVQINDNVLTIRAQRDQKGDGREEHRIAQWH
jgi:hypothetical protein